MRPVMMATALMIAARQAMSKLCLALDFPTSKEALNFLKPFEGETVMVKLGMQLYYAEPSFLKVLKDKGFEVFLDLKLMDIPRTVFGAISSLTAFKPDYLSIHALGGIEMLKAANEAKKDIKLLGISVLTSLDESDLRSFGLDLKVSEVAQKLALNMAIAGLDGFVSSAAEVGAIKEKHPNLIALTPGIRLEAKTQESAQKDDQKRAFTPQEASDAGSDILVLGRALSKSSDPFQTYLQIKDSLWKK